MYRSRSRRHSSQPIRPRYTALDWLADDILAGKRDAESLERKIKPKKRRRRPRVARVNPDVVEMLGESGIFATWNINGEFVTIGRDWPGDRPQAT